MHVLLMGTLHAKAACHLSPPENGLYGKADAVSVSTQKHVHSSCIQNDVWKIHLVQLQQVCS